VTAPELFKDDTAEAAPEELAREPETFTEERVAQAEEPKATPVTMLPVTVTVEADPLFDFDKYLIRADSRKKLDELIQQLRGVTYGEIIAVGFADPIGTAKYNKGLSERRAASVKRYLVNKGIPANRVRIEGRGRTEEFASYKDCRGQRKQKLIACLEPNRRVEVTVTAEKQK
jgi:OOP family OmpA-OmpF porin